MSTTTETCSFASSRNTPARTPSPRTMKAFAVSHYLLSSGVAPSIGAQNNRAACRGSVLATALPSPAALASLLVRVVSPVLPVSASNGVLHPSLCPGAAPHTRVSSEQPALGLPNLPPWPSQSAARGSPCTTSCNRPCSRMPSPSPNSSINRTAFRQPVISGVSRHSIRTV